MASRSCAYRSFYFNLLADPIGKQNKLADAQCPAEKLNVNGSEASTLPEAPTF